MKFEDLTFFDILIGFAVCFVVILIIVFIIDKLIEKRIEKEDNIPTLPEIKQKKNGNSK